MADHERDSEGRCITCLKSIENQRLIEETREILEKRRWQPVTLDAGRNNRTKEA